MIPSTIVSTLLRRRCVIIKIAPLWLRCSNKLRNTQQRRKLWVGLVQKKTTIMKLMPKGMKKEKMLALSRLVFETLGKRLKVISASQAQPNIATMRVGKRDTTASNSTEKSPSRPGNRAAKLFDFARQDLCQKFP